MKIKVQNLRSSNNNPVPNQFLIYQNDNIYFQSYYSTIAKIDSKGGLILDSNRWDYSRTTLKYLYNFIEQFKGFRPNKKSLTELIESKEIKTINLN